MIDLDDFDKDVLSRIALDFYARKEMPIVDTVTEQLKERIGFKGSRNSVRSSRNWLSFW